MPSSGKSLILVVDDNETARYSKLRILRAAGFEVCEAGTGLDGLALVAERRPNLVLLDVHLPDLDGWEVCRRIKADQATSSVLVLQISATFVSEADTVRAPEGGADGCLTEPLEPPVLVATVRALLRVRHAEDALREALKGERTARAAAEAASRTKDEFIATLSHELRSPLGAIVSWVSLLRGGRIDEARTARALEAIERNARLQTQLIEDLLDVSRIISGKMSLKLGLIELLPIVEAALDSARPAAEAKSIQLGCDLAPTVGPVLGDATRLQQVVWNLVSNAVKFTPKGGRVEVRLEPLDTEAQITVADSGKGIEPSFLPHIFERFRQADSSTTRQETGLGLGLAIVRHLVELHGGTVEATSGGRGQGATFVVRLPLPAVRPVARRLGVAAEPARQAFGTLAGTRVIVLDDERDARDAVAAVLEQSGAQVWPAGSVEEAIRLLDDTPVDVLVSDIAMPGMDGFAFIRRLRERTPERGGEVPALALTAYAGINDQQRILDSGFQAYLTKPIEGGEIVMALQRLLRAARRA